MEAKPIAPQKYLHTKIKAIIAFSILALALATVLNILFQCSNKIEFTTQQIKNAYERKLALSEIQSVVTDLETGARGYAITGNEKYLEQSNKSIGTVYNKLTWLKNNATDPQSVKALAALENLVDKKIDNSSRTIELRRNKNAAAAMQNIQQGDGRIFMDSIRTIIKNSLTKQNKLISEARMSETELEKFYSLIFILFAVILIVCVVVVFFMMRNIFLLLHQSTDELLQSNNFLTSLLENMPNMVFVKDAQELRFVRFNKAGEKLLGYKRQALIGKNDYDFFPKEQADFFIAKDREAIANEGVMDIKEELIDTANGKRWLRTKKIVLNDDRGKPAYLLGISEDITDQKLIGEKEKQYANEIINLFNNAPCGYIVTGIDGKVIEINDTFLKWLGYTRLEAFQHLNSHSIVTEDSLEIFGYYYTRFRTGELKSVQDLELRIKRKDGTTFPALINAVAEYDINGNFKLTKSTLFDITVLKEAQKLVVKN